MPFEGTPTTRSNKMGQINFQLKEKFGTQKTKDVIRG